MYSGDLKSHNSRQVIVSGREVQGPVNATITLTTDFGTADGYVAQMKGVILSRNGMACVVDATHAIQAFGIVHAALVIHGFAPYFPCGAIHIVVVDPGVGGNRRGMAVQAAGQFFVGPDNGVFTSILGKAADWRAHEITNHACMLPSPHSTFHGRDVFAPAAAYLSLGNSLESIGPRIEQPVTISIPEPRLTQSAVSGAVVHVDRFGNLVTNIDHHLVTGRSIEVYVAGESVGPLRAYFSQAREGRALALINSFGLLEVAINKGSASERFKARIGDAVDVEFLP